MSRSGFITVTAIAIWLILTALVYARMMRFDTQPGVEAIRIPARWPSDLASPAGLHLADQKLTLVVFLHPKCTCSSSTLAQIAKLQAQFPEKFATELVLWTPLNAESSWTLLPPPEHGTLTNYQVVLDPGGQLSKRFDAHTSGQTYIYDVIGQLRFAGGLTSYRANSEDGPAYSSLTKVIQGADAPKKLPVYGCSL